MEHNDEKNCCICWENHNTSFNTLTNIFNCKHIYHTACFNKWRNNSLPNLHRKCIICHTENEVKVDNKNNKDNEDNHQVADIDPETLAYMLDRKYKDCPNCGLWIEKIGGCDTITCMCGTKFMYTNPASVLQYIITLFTIPILFCIALGILVLFFYIALTIKYYNMLLYIDISQYSPNKLQLEIDYFNTPSLVDKLNTFKRDLIEYDRNLINKYNLHDIYFQFKHYREKNIEETFFILIDRFFPERYNLTKNIEYYENTIDLITGMVNLLKCITNINMWGCGYNIHRHTNEVVDEFKFYIKSNNGSENFLKFIEALVNI